jgi:hypothetical protein
MNTPNFWRFNTVSCTAGNMPGPSAIIVICHFYPQFVPD